MCGAVCLGISSCSDDDTPDDREPTDVVTEEQIDKVIATYVDRTVIPTYAEMRTKVGVLSTAVNTFIASGTQTDLQTACDAWVAARKPWEESEAFLYGPADYENLDPSLDSWPLDKDGIDQILSTSDWSEIEGDTEDAQSLRGFHTIEYLLFSEGKARKAEEVTANEKAYMQRIAGRLLEDTGDLHQAWAEGLGTDEVPVAFGTEMKAHNTPRTSSAFTVLGDFIIDGGIINILDEVGEQKIGGPYDLWKKGDKDDAVLQVESWYSWNSLTDYYDNIVSVENSYMGGRRENRSDATSISALVRLVDKDLDARVQAQIEAAKKAIYPGIPYPFRSNLDASAEIEAAMDACAGLADLFREVKNTLELN